MSYKSTLFPFLIFSIALAQGAGINPSLFEINIGAVPIDRYQDPTPQGTVYSNCPSSWTVRDCIKRMFNNDSGSSPYSANNYIGQGVTGVRFFYGLRGGANSTAFNVDGSVNLTWMGNLTAFLTDLRAFGVQRVTPTPVTSGNWSGPLVLRQATNCRGETKDLWFYPWLPFGLEVGNYYPDGQGDNDAYNCAASTPPDIWWGSLPMTRLIDNVLARVWIAGLVVADYDIENEVSLMDFTVYGRLIYDNTHTTDMLSAIQQSMAAYGFDGNRVTASVQAIRSNYAEFGCASVYGDSAALMNESELIAAVAGTWGAIGNPVGMSWTNNLPCGGTSATMISLPVYHPAATATNIHAYPCVQGDGLGGGGFGCNPSIDTTLTARLFFDHVQVFLDTRGLTANYVVFGETTPDQNCDAYTQTMAEQNGAGYRASNLYAYSKYNTVLRPWNNVPDISGCYQAPTYINNAYNPFF